MNFNNLEDKDLLNNEEELKKLTSEEIKKYMLIYNLYRNLFTEYVIKMTNLKKFDETINKSKMNFKPIELSEMDMYQYFSSNDLKYFYIRNDIYINKLNKEEMVFLQGRIDSNNYNLDEETTKIIENSYKRVICSEEKEPNIESDVFYGPLNSSFSAPDDNIIIGVRYDESEIDELDEKEWENLYFKQNEFLYDIMKKIQNELKDVTVIMYDEFSIIPRNLVFEGRPSILI